MQNEKFKKAPNISGKKVRETNCICYLNFARFCVCTCLIIFVHIIFFQSMTFTGKELRQVFVNRPKPCWIMHKDINKICVESQKPLCYSNMIRQSEYSNIIRIDKVKTQKKIFKEFRFNKRSQIVFTISVVFDRFLIIFSILFLILCSKFQTRLMVWIFRVLLLSNYVSHKKKQNTRKFRKYFVVFMQFCCLNATIFVVVTETLPTMKW